MSRNSDELTAGCFNPCCIGLAIAGPFLKIIISYQRHTLVLAIAVFPLFLTGFMDYPRFFGCSTSKKHKIKFKNQLTGSDELLHTNIFVATVFTPEFR